MPNKQKGFTAVEAVLILVIVGIIGFAGWFVLNSQKQTNKTLDDTAKSNSAAVSTKQSNTATTSSDTVQATDPADSNKYLVIKEWGVRIPYDATDTTLSYKLAGNGATIISSQLASKYQDCSTYGAGSVGRGLATETPGAATDKTYAEFYDDPSTRTMMAHIGQYYYIFVHDQALCTNETTQAATDAQNAANDLVKSLIPKLEAN